MRCLTRYIYFIAAILLIQACQKDADTDEPKPLSPVGFTMGTQSRNDYKLLISSSAQTITGLLNIKVQSGTAAAAANVKLIDSTSFLVNRYNTANGTSIVALPRSLWSMPAELVLPQGGTSVSGSITVTNTDGLDFNKLYAIGITIGNNDGYTIPDSSRSLLIVLRIGNILDGRYSMKGRFYHPSLEPGFALHVLSVELHTTGANNVAVYWPFASQFTTPATSGGGAPFCCIANNELAISSSNASNAVVAVNNNPVGSFYSALQTYNAVNYTNYYDATTGTVYLAFGSNLGAGGTLVPGLSRVWIDTLSYLGPR